MLLQPSSILLWKKAEKKEFNVICKETFTIYEELKKYPEICYPRYLTVRNKKDAKEQDLDYEQFEELLKRSRVDKNKPELGYYFSFFSSLVDSESAGITFSVGSQDERFINSIVIKLPKEKDLREQNNATEIMNIFYSCVKLFDPFWACVSNDINARKYGRYVEHNKPKAVHWINYWDEHMCDAIGNKLIQSVIDKYEKTQFVNGVFWLKDTPIDINSEADIRLQNQVMTDLKLI